MRTVDIEEARARLSELIALAVEGEPFIITIDGKPVVEVTAIDAPEPKAIKRIGFAKGRIKVPDDFDTMFQEEIEDMFYNGPIFPPEDEEEKGGGA